MNIDRRKLRGWLYRNVTPVDVKYDEVFSYAIGDQLITISHDIPTNIEWYIDYCTKKGLKYNVNKFVLCLLHEIGHDQTLIFLNDFLCFIDMIISSIIETDSRFAFIAKLKCQIYFRLPCENAATEWAIDFINNNIEKVRELESYVYE